MGGLQNRSEPFGEERSVLLLERNNNNNNTIQKTAILGTAHLLREVRMERYKTLNKGNNITCNINCKYRMAATLCEYILETCFVSGK